MSLSDTLKLIRIRSELKQPLLRRDTRYDLVSAILRLHQTQPTREQAMKLELPALGEIYCGTDTEEDMDEEDITYLHYMAEADMAWTPQHNGKPSWNGNQYYQVVPNRRDYRSDHQLSLPSRQTLLAGELWTTRRSRHQIALPSPTGSYYLYAQRDAKQCNAPHQPTRWAMVSYKSPQPPLSSPFSIISTLASTPSKRQRHTLSPHSPFTNTGISNVSPNFGPDMVLTHPSINYLTTPTFIECCKNKPDLQPMIEPKHKDTRNEDDSSLPDYGNQTDTMTDDVTFGHPSIAFYTLLPPIVEAAGVVARKRRLQARFIRQPNIM